MAGLQLTAEAMLGELAKGSTSRSQRAQLAATEALVRQLREADRDSIEQAMANCVPRACRCNSSLRAARAQSLDVLLEPLRQQLLSFHVPLAIETCAALKVLASRLGPQSLPLVEKLLPLLIDHTSCMTAASVIGYHAHATVCAILHSVEELDALDKVRLACRVVVSPRVALRDPTAARRHVATLRAHPSSPSCAAAAQILHTLSLRCSNSARRLLAHQLLLCLLFSSQPDRLRKRAQIISLSIQKLLTDPSVHTRTLVPTRHPPLASRPPSGCPRSLFGCRLSRGCHAVTRRRRRGTPSSC
jgi:hypothetical protein